MVDLREVVVALLLGAPASGLVAPARPGRYTRRASSLGACAPADEPPPPPLSALSALGETVAQAEVALPSGDACAAVQSPDERRRSVVLGIAAPLAAASLYFVQRANPVSPVKLLQSLDERSPPLQEALSSGRPTVVEFYAPWCVSCRESAPGLVRLKQRYGERVNFVLVNGDDRANRRLVELFGVDSIPHLALINGARKLESTLIGEVGPMRTSSQP